MVCAMVRQSHTSLGNLLIFFIIFVLMGRFIVCLVLDYKRLYQNGFLIHLYFYLCEVVYVFATKVRLGDCYLMILEFFF